MDVIIIISGLLILFWFLRPKRNSRPSKKFGEGLLSDTDTTNWKPPL
jgi:hypothetical protein